MKKKVLFALIALFSFLSSWAADVKAGDYTVTIATQYVALTDATNGVAAPAITAIEKGSGSFTPTAANVIDENGNLVDKTAIKTAGKYTWVLNVDADVIKVPFYVAVPTDLFRVNSAETFATAMQTGGAYDLYYKQYPWHDVAYFWSGNWEWVAPGQNASPDGVGGDAFSDEDITDADQNANDPTNENVIKLTGWYNRLSEDGVDVTRNWAVTSQSNPDNYVWVLPANAEGTFYSVFTNGELAVSLKAYSGGPAKVYGQDASYRNYDMIQYSTVNSTFGENVKLLFVPTTVDLTASVVDAIDLSNAAVIETSDLPYNGSVQYPVFSGENFNATVKYTYTPEEPGAESVTVTLVEGRDFTPVYEVDGDDYKSADTHNFTVNFIGAYAGSKDATYNITKAHVNINLAYIYKTYGEADPALPANPTAEQLAAYTNKLGFEIDASTPLKGTDVKSDIAKYLIFTRATGEENEGEDVREYDYYYEKTADFADNCNYTVSFLQTKSLLIIQPKAVTINVTPVYKEYHKTVELKYDAEVLKAQLAEADKAKASGTPGATDLITSITWEGAGTDAGEAVNADLTGTAPNQAVNFRNPQVGGYPMTATAAIVPATKKSNYNVTVAIPEQGFAIVPTTTADLTVEVPATEANGAVQVDGEWKFVYNGKFQKPAPVVKDGTVTLNPETDYDVTYENYQDAGTATCKVTLKGSYATSLTKSENFTIEKADLVVKPVSSISADDEDWTVTYEGFKKRASSADDDNPTQEDEASEYGRPSTPAHSYFSVDPDDIKVVKGAEIEQDVYVLEIQLPTGVTAITAKNYNVTIGTALLALNDKPILRVRPAQNQPGKVYDGEEPTAEELQELAIEVQHTTGNGYEAATANEIAALKILGTPVYTFTKAEGVDVGLYRLTVNGPAVLKDYNVEYDNTHRAQSSRNYPITPAAYFIVVNNDPAKLGTASKTYGSADPTFTLTAATRTGEGTAASPYVYTAAEGVTVPTTVRAVHLNNYNGADDAGNHDILVQRNTGSNNRPNWQAFANWEVGNYIFTSVNGVLNIAKKAVIFTADPKSKVYGTADPALTISPDPVVTDLYSEPLSKTNGVYDAFNISRVIPEGKTGEEVGTYTIKLEVKDVDATQEGVQLHNSLRNFDVTVQNGTFTIDQATYFVRANDQWIHFYNEINPLDVTIDLPGGETLRWQKAGINETAEQTAAREANNAKIVALGSLTVVEGKDAIGANKDAYKWNPKTNDNYALATGEAGSKTIPATAYTREYVYTDGFCNGYLTVYPLEYIPLENAELAELLGKEADAAGAQPSLLQTVLEAHKGLTIPVKMPARKLDADEWYTFVLPFPVKPSVLFGNEKFGYGALEILDAEQSKGNNVVFSLQMNEIPANTPFILKVETAVSAEEMNAITFNGVTIDSSINYLTENPTTGAEGNVQFVGLYYDKKGFTADQRYNAKVGDDPRGFYRGGDLSGSIVVKRTNAYLQFPSAVASANARIFIEEENGTLTEITGVEAGAEVTDGEGWYTITGVKLDAEPTTSGTYIFNGKKVFIQK